MLIATAAASFIAFLLLLVENDRRFSTPHPAKNYYIDDFPRPLLGLYNSLLYLFSKKGPIFPVSDFPHHELLEKNWKTIQEEMLHAYASVRIPCFHEIDPAQNRISDEKWKTLV